MTMQVLKQEVPCFRRHMKLIMIFPLHLCDLLLVQAERDAGVTVSGISIWLRA